MPFVSKLFPHAYYKRLLRTEPLKAMVVGAFVRGLSMRDVESLCAEAGLGRTSKSTAARICSEVHERLLAFGRRDLYEVKLVALFLDAIYLAVRPQGPKEGVLCAWGFTEKGERALVSVCLGMRESVEDWLALGRDLTKRGLQAPMLVAADGAPGLIKAVEELWPYADRQHCVVHRLRNLLAKLPKAERELVRVAYWHALDEATGIPDGKQRLKALIRDLDQAGYQAAARCLADDLDALVVHLRYPLRHRRRWRSTNLLERSLCEVRRRTKVIGRFPGETSCLSLVWAPESAQLAGALRTIEQERVAHSGEVSGSDRGHQAPCFTHRSHPRQRARTPFRRPRGAPAPGPGFRLARRAACIGATAPFDAEVWPTFTPIPRQPDTTSFRFWEVDGGCASSRWRSYSVRRCGWRRACEELVELGVEAMDKGEVPVNSPEHLEAGAVMGELGAVLGFVQLPRWQQRQLADFGDFVRREDRARAGVCVRDAVAQLAFAGLVIAERWIV